MSKGGRRRKRRTLPRDWYAKAEKRAGGSRATGDQANRRAMHKWRPQNNG